MTTMTKEQKLLRADLSQSFQPVQVPALNQEGMEWRKWFLPFAPEYFNLLSIYKNSTFSIWK